VAVIVSDRETADLFEQGAAVGHAGILAKQFISFWSGKANERRCTISGLGVDANRLGELSKLVADGVINATAAAAIAEKLIGSGDAPGAIAEREGLIQVQDAGQMQAWVDEVFAANDKAVQDAMENPKKQKQARGFLTGQVMKVSRGQADPKLAGDLIDKKLESMRG
jgi:aspartyl-tRNA(Asn)/glutamyl-tRNA(Gln) amidotransferase subunit B